MSERMIPIPFRRLMQRIVTEYRREGSVFGVSPAFRADEKTLPIFGEKIETPFGPAAGPNTQLAQNIVASYFAGARFFELKTVQKMDGAELAACIARPCITAADECYNCEWSTELTVPQAFEEYVKAWCACKMIARLFSLGSPDGFVFNMSVGYDLDGIRGEKVDRFLRGMTDASETPVFRSCIETLKDLFPDETAFIDTIPPQVSRSVTLSTLHGCPPQEIERIATYLIEEKHLHTFVKCNPTLLGYETARTILDEMGYDYVAFDDHHFREDLQWADAVPMFRRLQARADAQGVEFGLKLSNTFPVDVRAGELPSEEMYMAGKSLFPLTTEMAARVAAEFGGRIRISYAGGADAFNVEKLFSCGVFPVTMATTELKPGGYRRFAQIAEILHALPYAPFASVDAAATRALADRARTDRHHRKAIKPLPSRKLPDAVPLLDCFLAPCKGGCPIHQDIPEYLELVRKGKYLDALCVITEKNPLPFLTGTICAHRCQEKCTRNFYEDPVQIRAMKLRAAEGGYEEFLKNLTPPKPDTSGKNVAIVGGGPTGMAAAYFLARAGVGVTVFEKTDRLGGVPRHVIPAFRIADGAIEKDAELLRRLGATVRLNTPAPALSELKAQGFTHVFYAVGAEKAGRLDLSGNVVPVIAWLRDMKAGKSVPLGHVVVVGGGNTAMDAARAALRAGASSATVLYRRTKRYMPAEEEELRLALEDGVRFLELAAPVEQIGGALRCERMALGDADASGRRTPAATGEFFSIPCDTVVSAVGEQVDPAIFVSNGVALDARGRAPFATNLENVYAGGDAHRGPATIVEGIADAAAFAEAVLGASHVPSIPQDAIPDRDAVIARRGVLREPCENDGERCLACSLVCQNCADVCPNRANAVITLPDGRHEILHLDALCNECGNCEAFCPYASAPYRDKFTLYPDAETLREGPQSGFFPLGSHRVLLRLNGDVREVDLDRPNDLPPDLALMILTVLDSYESLLP